MIKAEIQQKIREMWDQNLTTREIGAALGLSKNSVCGLLHRMRTKGVDLPKKPRNGSTRTQKREQIAKVEKVTALKVKAAAKPVEPVPEIVVPVVPPPLPKPAEKQGRFRFIDLRRNSCRYVVSGKTAEEFMFCGEPKKRGAYCEEHAKLCYVPLSKEARRSERTFKLTRMSGGI